MKLSDVIILSMKISVISKVQRICFIGCAFSGNLKNSDSDKDRATKSLLYIQQLYKIDLQKNFEVFNLVKL